MRAYKFAHLRLRWANLYEIDLCFQQQGGVGKTTLTFHLTHALAEMGKKTLIIDFDPQCNLTIFSLPEEMIYDIWKVEDPYIEDFGSARKKDSKYTEHLNSPRSIHFLLKPTEDGTGDIESLPPPVYLAENLSIIPGRLTLHLYEEKISSRWSDVYQGDPLAIRTVNRVRTIAEDYAKQHGFDIVIYDTSPSLGSLNKVVISIVDGFVIPCNPDMFSLYGIRNIGNSLAIWKKQFDTIFHLLSNEKRQMFPEKFVSFLGFTIYNARKYSGQNELDLATAHYNFAQQIPTTVREFIGPELRNHLSESQLREPIGTKAVMHSHSTLPSMAQKYHTPIWLVPTTLGLESQDKSTISGNRGSYEGTQPKYHEFADAVLDRLKTLG
ncbi:ParA family protein [Methylorubrum extorquens]